MAGLRARLAVFFVPAADLFVFAIFLLASFRPDAVVRVRLPAERFFGRAALPIDPFAPPFRTVVFLATAPLPARFLAAALLATPFLLRSYYQPPTSFSVPASRPCLFIRASRRAGGQLDLGSSLPSSSCAAPFCLVAYREHDWDRSRPFRRATCGLARRCPSKRAIPQIPHRVSRASCARESGGCRSGPRPCSR